MKLVFSFERSCSTYCNNPETCFLNIDTGLQLIKSFSRNLAIKLAIFFTAVLSLRSSHSHFLNKTEAGQVLLLLIYLKKKGHNAAHSTLPSITISLSHTHTRTHTNICAYVHPSSGQVSSKYSAATDFQQMSNTNCILHEVVIFQGWGDLQDIYLFNTEMN